MAILNTIKLATTHFQYVGLLKNLRLPFPTSFLSMIDFVDVINLNFSFILDNLDLPAIDGRTIFIFVSVGLPLALMLLTALVFFSLKTILEISNVLMAIVIFAAFIVNACSPGFVSSDISDALNLNLCLVAVGFLLGAVFSKLAHKLSNKIAALEFSGELIKISSIVGGLTIYADVPWLAFQCIIGVVALSICHTVFNCYSSSKAKPLIVLLTLGSAAYVIAKVQWSVTSPPQLQSPCLVLVGIGFLRCLEDLLYSSSGSTSARIRQFRLRFKKFLDSSLLSLALFGLSCAFVPVVTNCLEMFLCKDYHCPEGSKFNPRAPRPTEELTVSPDLFCDPCDFLNNCHFSTATLCPAYKSSRLLKFPEVGCHESNFTLFMVAAGIVLVVFCIIIMVLYHRVILCCTNALFAEVRGADCQTDDGFKLPSTVDPAIPYSLELEWDNLLKIIDTKASSLYRPYRYEFRYFLLFETFAKVVVVGCSVVMAPFYGQAVFPITIMQFSVLVFHAAWRPLVSPQEQNFAIVLAACEFINATYAILLWRSPDFFSGDAFGIVLLIINILLPTVIGIVLIGMGIKEAFEGPHKKSTDIDDEEDENAVPLLSIPHLPKSDDLNDLGPSTVVKEKTKEKEKNKKEKGTDSRRKNAGRIEQRNESACPSIFCVLLHTCAARCAVTHYFRDSYW